MQTRRLYWMWLVSIACVTGNIDLPLYAQMTVSINSFADDIDAHPWDDPDTKEDESRDGVCLDMAGRRTIRAAIEEAWNMNDGNGVPCHITFVGTGEITLTEGPLSLPDYSSIQGNHVVTMTSQGVGILGLSHHCTVEGMKFVAGTYPVEVSGDDNVIADNTFSNCFTCVEVAGLRNTIGPGNIFHDIGTGIHIAGDDNIVKGNRIGLDDQGAISGNGFGVAVDVGVDNVIGGTNPGDRNIISGNRICGIRTATLPWMPGSTTIIGNFIGTDVTGTQPKQNGYGIQVLSGRARIGGATPSERNIISGNANGGIETRGDALAISIIGNCIGTDSSETLSIGNGSGIDLSPGSFDCLVEGNSIMYNGDGISIVGIPANPSWNHRIRGNKIKRNSWEGIFISGTANDIVIGSSLTQDFAPNEIQLNGTSGLPSGYGVSMVGSPSTGMPRANTIRKNYFRDNHMKSIYLLDNSQDQIGAPTIQDYSDLGNGHALVTITHHRPGSLIDVYEADQTIGPNYEGGPWLGSGFEGADTTFTFQILSCSTNSIVATATDGAENTSEFNAFSIAPLPITLLSFTGTVTNSHHVRLEWTTLTEINNYGFEIQRSLNSENNYSSLPNSFIPGHGTTNEPHHYTFADSTGYPARWYYRLKQIDLDGAVHYSDGIAIDIATGVTDRDPIPDKFFLDQNYPNPFNPRTEIVYGVKSRESVSLIVFDLLGREAATLVDEVKEAGMHSITFDASDLPSGVYFYRLRTNGFDQTRKLLLMK